MYHKFLVLAIVVIFSNTAFAQPIKIDSDIKINHSVYEGIKVIEDCKITFKNTDDIMIGDMYSNVCPGIEIVPGKKLTICQEGCGNVNIYGGCYQNLGNMYSCAGIYVPTKGTLVIEGKSSGILNVIGYTGAAGIGGQGVAIYSSDVDYSIINAGNIYIKSGNVVAVSYCNNSTDCNGTGAGIGGGGIYNLIDRRELLGGSVERIDIYDGDVIAIGGNSENCNGTGAGIGGGGVCNAAQKVDYLRGGNLNQINILGGNITARGGSNNNTKGIGVGIGGGGIYNSGNCELIVEGRLINISNGDSKRVHNFRENIKIGSGSVYSNDTHIKGLSPSIIIKNSSTTLKESIKDSSKKIISTVLMFIAGVLVMVGK